MAMDGHRGSRGDMSGGSNRSPQRQNVSQNPPRRRRRRPREGNGGAGSAKPTSIRATPRRCFAGASRAMRKASPDGDGAPQYTPSEHRFVVWEHQDNPREVPEQSNELPEHPRASCAQDGGHRARPGEHREYLGHDAERFAHDAERLGDVWTPSGACGNTAIATRVTHTASPQP